MKKIFAILVVLFICTAALFGVSQIFYSDSALNSIVQSVLKTDTAQEVENDLKNKTSYYYNNLDDDQKIAYRLLYKAVMNFDETATVQIPESDLSKIWTAVFYDNPEIFWVGYEYEYLNYNKKIEITPTYLMTKLEADDITTRLDSKINEIVISAEQFETDYDKELFFHDYICRNAVYDKSTFEKVGHTAYSLLLDGKGICEGYSRAMQMLLDRVGIKNYLVTGNGTSNGETQPHMWNIVEIDGKNYHLDVTWDDLEAKADVGHLYFNITDSDILLDHSDLQPQNNGCTYTEANYFHRSNTYVSLFTSFSDLIEPCDQIVKSGQKYVELQFEVNSDFLKAMKIIEKDNNFFDFVEAVSEKSGGKFSSEEIEYFSDEKYNYLCIIFKED